MMTLAELWMSVGDGAGSSVASIYDRLIAAGAQPHEIARALSLRITADNLSAAALGEGAAVAQLEKWGLGDEVQRVAAEALEHELDRERLRIAATTVLDRLDPSDAATVETVRNGLHRLARCEAVEAAQTMFGHVMRQAESVKGWTRQLEPDACQLCRWWSRDGRIWPKNHTMPTHKGCACAQEFTTVARIDIQTVGRRAAEASKQRAAAGTLEERRTMDEGVYSARSTRGSDGETGT